MFGTHKKRLSAITPACAFLALLTVSPSGAAREATPSHLNRPPEDEIVYFVLPDRFENARPDNDRGGMSGDRLTHGFDPTHQGFYHGGDLAGLTSRLDYIESLGATAIWLGPIYKNKPVQGPPGRESAGYHGYWITDFTTVDPHYGTEAELKAFVDAAHERGIKIYLDIITNHTADVIAYRECHDRNYKGADRQTDGCAYRSKAEYPYGTRGNAGGRRINRDFMGDATPFQTVENFERLERADFAYTPFISAGEENVKTPAWLNDPIYYHNRGDSFWIGESALYGDFSGLDDLMTEDPRVLAGMIEIYKDWITKYRIDGFRIDTAKHVNPEFWRPFVKAMLDHAEKEGIPKFFIFGEAFTGNPAELARFTRVDGFPAVLDFAFQSAVHDVVAKGAPAIRFAELFAADDLYEGGAATARKLPNFIGNHDMGRFATFVRQENPEISDDALSKRVELAHAMAFFLRGAPVLYYGDEQGFNGDGNDQAAREDMFASRVASYNDNNLIGTGATTADTNFNTRHPLFGALANMAHIYKTNEPLRRGEQMIRAAEHDGGLLAVTRLSKKGGEYLVVFNASDDDRQAHFNIDPRSRKWSAVHGACERTSRTPGNVHASIPAWGYVICKSNEWSGDE